MDDIKLDYYLCLKTLDLVKIYISKIAKKKKKNYHLPLSKVVSILGLILSSWFTKSQR